MRLPQGHVGLLKVLLDLMLLLLLLGILLLLRLPCSCTALPSTICKETAVRLGLSLVLLRAGPHCYPSTATALATHAAVLLISLSSCCTVHNLFVVHLMSLLLMCVIVCPTS
jgi:hypothetical protein